MNEEEKVSRSEAAAAEAAEAHKVTQLSARTEPLTDKG